MPVRLWQAVVTRPAPGRGGSLRPAGRPGGERRVNALPLPLLHLRATEVEDNDSHSVFLQQANLFPAQRQPQLRVTGNYGNLVPLLNKATADLKKRLPGIEPLTAKIGVVLGCAVT